MGLDFIQALPLLFHPSVLLFMCIGVLAGMIIGALPGLTDPMALGLAIPFTFSMEPVQAILFLLGIHFGAVYGGSITAILINTPGTPAGAAAALDGYPLTLQGQSRKALQMSAISAFIGALISVAALMIFAPLLSKAALKFGPSEYFALGLFGLSVVAGVAGRSLSKALIAASLGIFVSFIGTDPIVGTQRFTFGSAHLTDGLDLVPVLIGLFAIPEILTQLLPGGAVAKDKDNSSHVLTGMALTFADLKRSLKTIIKGSGIGVLIGALPGTGAVISSFFSYNEAVRSSKTPEKYGKGELDGVAAAESGSVSTESSALIPLLTFGIPGDVSTAILLGAFILHGVHVGPQLFQTSGDIVGAIFLGIILLEALVFLSGWYGSSLVSKLVRIPKTYLFSVITVLVVTGSYALTNDMFNVWVTLIFGILGYAMRRLDYPVVPLLLGIILGPIIEKNFLLAMASSGGDLASFLIQPLTAGILILAALSMVFTLRMHRNVQRRLNKEE
ncbi:tripartite tricarboxylate transporter permease [Paenibacillus sp. HB172176]|uniref:tripartite tricarboxylate transporter permease n=1 Tax=Paenibacillus sp. HB172176 TaxID=2493690 RepID=UPI0014393211|nr:tripartite tricarboxylate transporter permease [Paenibacillus sp. HB172176]